jgi:hypothetical protein
MPEIRVKKWRNPVEMKVEALIQGGALLALPEPDRPRAEGKARRVANVFTVPAEAMKALVESREYAEAGVKAAATGKVAQGFESIKPFEQEVEQLKAVVDATRTKALGPWVLERTPETLMLEREIRDRLVGQEKLKIGAKYLAAIGEADTLFVSAIDRAPAAFSLIDEDTRRRGEELKIEQSPLKAELEAQQLEHDLLSSMVATVKTELRKLAQQYGVSLETSASAAN